MVTQLVSDGSRPSAGPRPQELNLRKLRSCKQPVGRLFHEMEEKTQFPGARALLLE